MTKIIPIVIIIILMISCEPENKNSIDVSKIDINVSIDRFEEKFYNSNKNNLQNLKNSHPFLFPEYEPDSIWLNRINDKFEIELFNKSQEVFTDFKNERNQIESLFKHIKYYNPNFKEPQIITLITNLDYKNKVMYMDEFLFISLDLYLGKNEYYYNHFPTYISQNFDKTQLIVDIAKSIIEYSFRNKNSRRFLDHIIAEGKKMYLLDCYLPLVSGAQKMGYSIEKNEWIEANELPIWEYFLENKILYSTDQELYTRFISNAPFSKFSLDIDNQSPGRAGIWVGWKIVRAYMKNNDITIEKLLQTDSETILNNSKYKPKK